MDMFPPLCNRIKIQLVDSDVTRDDPIGTHFIELPQIMDPGGDSEGNLYQTNNTHYSYTILSCIFSQGGRAHD